MLPLLFTPDERRALLALGLILTLGLFARIIAPGPIPPTAGGDSLLVVRAGGPGSVAPEVGSVPPPGLIEEGRVRINEASAEEMAGLPGIGPVLGARIVEERKRSGPFNSLDDLRRVRGIGPKTAARLDRYLSFYLSRKTGVADCTSIVQPAGRADAGIEVMTSN